MNDRLQHIKDIEMVFRTAIENNNFSAALKAKEMILKDQDKERKELEETRKLEEEQAEKHAQEKAMESKFVPLKEMGVDNLSQLMESLKNDARPNLKEIQQEIRQLERDLAKRDALKERLEKEVNVRGNDDTKEVFENQEENKFTAPPGDGT